MKKYVAVFLIAFSACAGAEDHEPAGPEASALCSSAWQQQIDESVVTGDGQGHGPDIGSDEWKSVVEFKLGIRGKPGVPGRDSEAWCAYVDQVVRGDRVAQQTGPSFSCDKAAAGSIEEMICKDAELSALDRKLSDVYAAATKLAVNMHPPVLKSEQRGWIKGRDACWKSDTRRECVRQEYVRRITELQAWYRLVPHSETVFFICDGNPSNEVAATFFETDPATLIAERGDSTSLMYRQPSASGSKYQGRNETLWEHQGEALITWGAGAPEMHCKRSP